MYLAVESENIEIVKLLLSNEKIDVNLISIFNLGNFNKIHKILIIQIKFKENILNDIQKLQLFE